MRSDPRFAKPCALLCAQGEEPYGAGRHHTVASQQCERKQSGDDAGSAVIVAATRYAIQMRPNGDEGFLRFLPRQGHYEVRGTVALDVKACFPGELLDYLVGGGFPRSESLARDAAAVG